MSLLNKIAPWLLAPLPDKWFLQIQYLYKQRKLLNLKNPRTLNEKIQWSKLHERNPLMVQCVDKWRVREYVASQIGDEVLIPLLGVYSSVDQIPFGDLPPQFVLKANHGSGWNIICRNKAALDVDGAKKKLNKWLKSDFSRVGREWAYRGIPPRICAEKYLADARGEPPADYKFFCFHGKVGFVQVDQDRFLQHTRSLYSPEWKKLPCALEYPIFPDEIAKPENLDAMIELAEMLAKSFAFVRVDLYSVSGNIYFGELTFYPGKGVERFCPASFDEQFGSLLDLQKI